MTFVESPNKTVTNGRQIDLWVVHDMEAPPGPFTAENVADYFTRTSVRASAHYNYDQDSEVQSVLEKDVAWHAPGANHNGIGAEHAGYARFTYDEWQSPEGIAMLRISAARCADVCIRYGIPIRFVDAAGLLRGERGITTHLEATRAFKKGTHWDPGYEFPMDLYIGFVLEAAGGTAPPIPVISNNSVADGDNLNEGDEGPEVEAWQIILRGWGAPIGNPPDETPDGKFGPTTKESTMRWQAEVLGYTGKDVDGIVGPMTRADTARVLAWISAINSGIDPVNPPAPAPAPVPTADVPPFPLPEGHWYGPKSPDDRNHSGYWEGDRNGISQYQNQMQARGWAIDVNGIYGEGTRSVTEAFQQEKGLGVDGLVGPETWTAAWKLPVT